MRPASADAHPLPPQTDSWGSQPPFRTPCLARQHPVKPSDQHQQARVEVLVFLEAASFPPQRAFQRRQRALASLPGGGRPPALETAWPPGTEIRWAGPAEQKPSAPPRPPWRPQSNGEALKPEGAPSAGPGVKREFGTGPGKHGRLQRPERRHGRYARLHRSPGRKPPQDDLGVKHPPWQAQAAAAASHPPRSAESSSVLPRTP